MKSAEKLDWLEFTVMYCKNPGQVRTEIDELDSHAIHLHKFGDKLIQAFLSWDGMSETVRNKLIKDFAKWVIPDEWHKYYDFDLWKILPFSLRGFALIIQIGADNSYNFQVRVPMKEADDFDFEHNYFVFENPRRGCLQTYNPFIGYRIVISGSNIPIERKMLRGDHHNGTVFPVRFHSVQWINDLMQFGALAKIGRIDVALDVAYDFNLIAQMWNDNPYQFKVPYFKKHCRIDYNQFTGAGEICCGKRGAANDSYLRIYNKAAEQGSATDKYPWDNYFADYATPACMSRNKDFREVPWTRFELELRGAVAIHFLTAYFDRIMDDDAPAHFIFDYIGIYSIESERDQKNVDHGMYCRLSPSPLWTEVISSYNLYCKAGNENFVQFGEELHDKNFKVSAAATRFLYRGTPYRTGLRLLNSVNRSVLAFESCRGSSDALKKVSDLLCSAEDIVNVIQLMPVEFADVAVRQRLEDISRMCSISKQRASDVLNEAGMKNYFRSIVSQVKRVTDLSADSEEDSDGFIYPVEFGDHLKIE